MGWFNSLFSITAADLLGANKRKPIELQESPAKKAKQQAVMPNRQAGHELEPDELKKLGNHVQARGDTAGTQHPISIHQELQLQYNPDRYQPKQQQDLLQQQQRPADVVFGGLGGSGQSQSQSQAAYQTARQMLVQPPSGTAAPRRQQAASLHKQKDLRMPMLQQKPPMAQSGQAGQQSGATPWYRRSSSYGRGSPQLYQFTPGTGGGKQRGGYGTKGPPPPRYQPQQQQVQQQQQLRPSYLAAAAGRTTADVATISRPQFGSAVAAPTAGHDGAAAGGQHRAAVPQPWAPAAAAGAGPPRRSESPPAPQRLFDGLPDDRSAVAAAGWGAGQPLGAYGAASGAGFVAGSSALTPPANFGAVLREEFQAAPGPSSSSTLQQQAVLGYGSMNDALEKQAAELEAKLAVKAAQFEKAQHKSKQVSQHASKLVSRIDSACRIDANPDYKHSTHDSLQGVQALQEQTITRNHQLMLKQDQHLLHLRQQHLERQELLQKQAAAAVPALPSAPCWKPKTPQEWKQLEEQQQQHEEEEDDDVVVVSSDEGGSDQQQYSEEEGSEVLSDEEGDDDEEAVESEEVDEAAAGIGALGITRWITRPSSWSCTPDQISRYESHTQVPPKPLLHEVVVSHARSKLELTRYDLSTMKPGDWLNDECMNMYMALLQDRDLEQRSKGGLACHFFSTFFLNKLFVDENKYNYQNVRRWTGPPRLKGAGLPVECVLTACERVIIPVHEKSHWTALMVDIKAKRLVYFDSLLRQNRRAVTEVKKWVADEAKDKLQATWDTCKWEEVYCQKLPRQENGCDCGVFALMFCNRMGVRGGAFDFQQEHIRYNIRAAIVCDLLDGKIQATAWRD